MSATLILEMEDGTVATWEINEDDPEFDAKTIKLEEMFGKANLKL